jgi:hypothetical protein
LQHATDVGWFQRVSATGDERARRLPGDEIIAHPRATLTHAITVHRPPADVWPWLAQMGAGSRAGWYSYDALDNRGQPSASRIVPELQALAAGMVMPAAPGVTQGFEVITFEPDRSLILGWREQGVQLVTWAFVLDPIQDGSTRLLVRVRASSRYRVRRLPSWVEDRVIRLVHFVMQRKQLLGLARRAEEYDALLDRFLPDYDAVERHAVRVAAPAATALAAAMSQDLLGLRLVRAIVRARELALGARRVPRRPSQGLVADMQAIGWGVLAEVPGREVIMGGVTRPWEPNPVFRALPPREFAAFRAPGMVKIAWSLRVDAAGPDASIVRTETRAAATDAWARNRFQAYWAMVSRGTAVIRRALLASVKRDAERAARSVRRAS